MVSMVQPSFKLLILEKAAAEGSNFLNTTDTIGREQSLYWFSSFRRITHFLCTLFVFYTIPAFRANQTSDFSCGL